MFCVFIPVMCSFSIIYFITAFELLKNKDFSLHACDSFPSALTHNLSNVKIHLLTKSVVSPV